ncbi:hypothetical protein [Ottowia thiooxydans]|uniref:hypothetical protein n=1 Tax=Ottowia thiooxydans TaxID=219182 RepID=UPI0004030545|nr:hypothetical protein [Ottowia thiooxydans]
MNVHIKSSGLKASEVASSTGKLRRDVVKEPTVWWEDRDISLMPFYNFYILVVQYQIHHELSDSRLAEEIGVSPQALVSWRKAIKSHGVLDGLNGVMMEKYADLASKENKKSRELDWDLELGLDLDWDWTSDSMPKLMLRLKENLKVQRDAIDRTKIPLNRDDFGRPRDIFPLPMPDLRKETQEGILKPLHFAVKGGPGSTPSIGRLKALVLRLNSAHLEEPPTDPQIARDNLMRSLENAGALQAKLRFSQKFFPHESREKISTELMEAISLLRRSAHRFFTEVALRSMNEGWWWDSVGIADLHKDESFSDIAKPFSTIESLPKAEQLLVAFTFKKIEKFASSLEVAEPSLPSPRRNNSKKKSV